MAGTKQDTATQKERKEIEEVGVTIFDQEELKRREEFFLFLGMSSQDASELSRQQLIKERRKTEYVMPKKRITLEDWFKRDELRK